MRCSRSIRPAPAETLSYESLIKHVRDWPGHDGRDAIDAIDAIDASKFERELG